MVDIEAERNLTRVEVADYLRTFADELEAGAAPSSTEGTGGTETDHRKGRSDSQRADNADSTDETETAKEAKTTEAATDDDRAGTEEVNDEHTRTEQNNQSNQSSHSDRRVTLMVGNESTTINPPETVTFVVTVDSDSSLIGSGTGRTTGFALHWDEQDAPEDEGLSIQ